MGPENNVGLGGCWIMEYLLPYLCMVTVPHKMVGLERMSDWRGFTVQYTGYSTTPTTSYLLFSSKCLCIRPKWPHQFPHRWKRLYLTSLGSSLTRASPRGRLITSRAMSPLRWNRSSFNSGLSLSLSLSR